MKNTYKYIAAFVAFSAVALSSGLTASAQNLDTGTYIVENGIAFAKRAILNADGTYTIDLETFVTGEVTQTYESVPADVVLVLDVSSSMDETITNYSYIQASVSSINGGNWSIGQTGTQSTGYYYKYNDAYYEVLRGRAQPGGWFTNYYYFLQFTANGTVYYINTSGQVVTERPSNVTNSSTNLLASNVKLYTRQASNTTKIDALKSAVRAFLSTMNNNDLVDPETGQDRSERLGNRVAIVAFSGASTLGQSDHDNSIQLNTGWKTLGESVTDSTGLGSLKTDLQGLTPNGGTHVEYGMQDALALIQDSEADVRTVVVFTDGVPGAGSWDGAGKGQNAQRYITETMNSANDAIDYSKQINAITIGSGDDATNPIIYAVGLFDTKPTEGSNTYTYMNYLSSNYPNASSMTSGGTKDSNDYYLDASGGSAKDLEDIFVAIAHSAGGSGNTEVSGGSTLTVDIVSSSFSVPQGFEDHPENAITVLVAPCNAITTIGGKEYLQFGEAKVPSFYGLDSIEPSISEDDNKVSTTGFDYSANWCGPDPTSTSAYHNYAYHGYKQIIRFTITVKDDAVGGPAVETNDADSGIYLEGSTTPLISFNRPTVKLPVQIWIQKNGLQGEDSAVFTLARAPFVENFNPATATWESVTKIVVGPDDYDPVTGVYLKKQVGLSPDYFYRIKEDAWAFGYQYQYGGILYTVGEEVHNPFVFENTPKNKKFDEAQARNVFKEKPATK